MQALSHENTFLSSGEYPLVDETPSPFCTLYVITIVVIFVIFSKLRLQFIISPSAPPLLKEAGRKGSILSGFNFPALF